MVQLQALSLSPLTPEYDIRKALSCDIIEPYPVKEGVMRLWQWVPMWVWLAGLGAIEAGGKLLVSGGEKRGWGIRDNAPEELETSPGPFPLFPLPSSPILPISASVDLSWELS